MEHRHTLLSAEVQSVLCSCFCLFVRPVQGRGGAGASPRGERQVHPGQVARLSQANTWTRSFALTFTLVAKSHTNTEHANSTQEDA